MRNMRMALFVLAATLGFGTQPLAAQDACSIRDSALCLANKNCHWDGAQARLLPGPRSLCRPMLIARRRSDLRVGRHAWLPMDRRGEEMRV